MELTVVAGISLLVLSWRLEAAQLQAAQERREDSAQWIRAVADAAQAHWAAAPATSVASARWPANVELLQTRLRGFPAALWDAHIWGLTAETDNLILTIGNVTDADIVANLLGHDASATSTSSVRLTLLPPGFSPDLQQFYLLDGTRSLRGNLNASNHSMSGIATLRAQTIRTSILVLEDDGTVVRP